MQQLYWLSPHWLWLLILPWLALAGYRWWSKRVFSQAVDAHLLSWMQVEAWHWQHLPWRWWWVWCGLVVAMAQPVWLTSAQQAAHQPMRWVALVDVSASMDMDDVKPSRLQQVKWTLESLSKHWQPGDQVGLWVFSGSAHALVPITADKSLWLQGLDMLAVDMLPLKGSLLLESLDTLSRQLTPDVGVLVLTDGGELAHRPLPTITQSGLLVGVGTRSGPLASHASMAAERPALGVPVNQLQQLSKQLKWDYVSLSEVSVTDISDWLQTHRQAQPLPELKDLAKIGVSMQSWVLLFALFAWFSMGQGQSSAGRSSLNAWVVILALAGMGQPLPVLAQSLDEKAHQLWQSAQVALENKRYTEADQQLLSAFEQSLSPELQGNILLTLGKSLAAQSQWYAAGQAFRGALAQDAQLTEAKEQLALVMRKMPRALDKSSQADKAGNHFEGVVAEWDESALDWESKTAFQDSSGGGQVSLTSLQKQSSAVHESLANPVMEMAEQRRQDWVLSGEMRQKQQDQRQFYRRLFSLEAGFGAVQEKAQPIEGIAPW